MTTKDFHIEVAIAPAMQKDWRWTLLMQPTSRRLRPARSPVIFKPNCHPKTVFLPGRLPDSQHCLSPGVQMVAKGIKRSATRLICRITPNIAPSGLFAFQRVKLKLAGLSLSQKVSRQAGMGFEPSSKISLTKSFWGWYECGKRKS